MSVSVCAHNVHLTACYVQRAAHRNTRGCGCVACGCAGVPGKEDLGHENERRELEGNFDVLGSTAQDEGRRGRHRGERKGREDVKDDTALQVHDPIRHEDCHLFGQRPATGARVVSCHVTHVSGSIQAGARAAKCQEHATRSPRSTGAPRAAGKADACQGVVCGKCACSGAAPPNHTRGKCTTAPAHHQDTYTHATRTDIVKNPSTSSTAVFDRKYGSRPYVAVEYSRRNTGLSRGKARRTGLAEPNMAPIKIWATAPK